MRFAFIDVEKTSYPMRILCRVLKVSPSGYYAWRNRQPSQRDLDDEQLRPQVVAAFKTGRGTYGRCCTDRDLAIGPLLPGRLSGTHQEGLRHSEPRHSVQDIASHQRLSPL